MNIKSINRSQVGALAVAGLVATFVMSLTGFWQSGIGLVAMDPAASMVKSMNAAHTDIAYLLNWGVIYHYANGIILALVYYLFVDGIIPGNWLVKGVVYGVLTTLLVALVISPIGFGMGVFFAKTPAPLLVSFSSLVAHGAYALTLTLSLKASDLIR